MYTRMYIHDHLISKSVQRTPGHASAQRADEVLGKGHICACRGQGLGFRPIARGAMTRNSKIGYILISLRPPSVYM